MTAMREMSGLVEDIRAPLATLIVRIERAGKPGESNEWQVFRYQLREALTALERAQDTAWTSHLGDWK